MTKLYFEAIYGHDKHYQTLGLEPGVPLKQVKERWKSLMSSHHSDKGGETENATRYNNAMDVIELSHGEEYKLYQQTILAFFAEDPRGFRDVLPGLMECRRGDLHFKASPEGIEQMSEALSKLFAVASITIVNAIGESNLPTPTVLAAPHSIAQLVNANNYTQVELLQLYELVTTGKDPLPYSLRYKHTTGVTQLHQLLVGLINAQRVNPETLTKARAELIGYQQADWVSCKLSQVITASVVLGLVLPLIPVTFMENVAQVSAYFALPIMAGYTLGATVLLVGVILPSLLGMAYYAHRHYNLKHYDVLCKNITLVLASLFIVTETLSSTGYV